MNRLETRIKKLEHANSIDGPRCILLTAADADDGGIVAVENGDIRLERQPSESREQLHARIELQAPDPGPPQVWAEVLSND